MREEVVLVDTDDREVGLMEKMQAHKEGKLHRAFSVFLLNDKNELLLQRRALQKYHCGGMWTNTCCSHPRANETLQNAVDRRLAEELGITCATEKLYSFIYKADVGNNLVEHEFDHVFFGRFSAAKYTPWFKIILAELNEKGILQNL
jgi:isopentenyl-diphosphate delta-isomerase